MNLTQNDRLKQVTTDSKFTLSSGFIFIDIRRHSAV